ncbi:MAG TPA: NADH-quinone oxidoreductase subunit NuoG [Syntrophobacteraceae bacterium]|nr:NADH-quinone oxidoreductase subunit NuoG [Syntrophobacteraceae bacterium]
MPRLIIDDIEVEVPGGSKVIEAAERLGIVIPRFCYHEALGSVGACRMCAVKFVQGPFKGVQMSCMIDAQDGMVVSTTDEEAVQFRKRVIELLMMNHPLDCPVCDEGGQCLLQDETVSGGHGIRRFRGSKRTYRDQYLGPYIQHEMNRCIHCYRCSRYYQEFAGFKDLGPLQIGNRMYFGRFSDGKLESPFSGNLVDICPTGVYTDKTARFKVRRWDLQRAPSLCNYCPLGCNTVANAHYRGVMRVEARFNQHVNGYFICDVGRFGFSYSNGGADHQMRPLAPRIAGNAVSAQAALAGAGKVLRNVAEKYGPRAIAAVGSARNSLEVQCMLRRICRNRDWQGPVFFFDPAKLRKTRSAVENLDGEIAVSMREIEKADLVILVGADPLNEAAMSALAIRQAARRGAPVIAIDPRPVFVPCDLMHIPAAPAEIEPYLALLVGRAVEKDSAGFEKKAMDFYRALLAKFGNTEPPAWIGELSGQLQSSRRPVIICGTDVTRETTPAFAAGCVRLLRLAGKEAGLFYLMAGAGSFSSALLCGSDTLPTFADLIGDIEKGLIKALVVAESDPFHYYPDRQRLGRAISKLDHLIAIDYFPSETVNRASVFYPASTIFETGSTYINQEGRVQFARQVHQGGAPIWGGEHPPRLYRNFIPGGDHLPAWKVLWEIAGGSAADAAPANISPAEFIAAENAVFEVFGSGNYPVDGIRVLKSRSGPEGPWDSLTPGSEPGPGACSVRGPGQDAGSLEKSTGSDGLELLMVEWMFGTSEFSAWSDSLDAAGSEPYMSMNPKDAESVGICDGDRVSLELDNGSLEIMVSVSHGTAEGVLVVPRHRSLDWRKMKDFSVRVLPGKISKLI